MLLMEFLVLKNVITNKKISNFRLVFDLTNFFVLVSCFNYLSNQYFVYIFYSQCIFLTAS